MTIRPSVISRMWQSLIGACTRSQHWTIQRMIEQEQEVQRRIEGKEPFALHELTYSANARCRCGAGLAYPNHIGTHGAWYCSRLLRFPMDELNHDPARPFVFWEVKSERQPSAKGATTRPQS